MNYISEKLKKKMNYTLSGFSGIRVGSFRLTPSQPMDFIVVVEHMFITLCLFLVSCFFLSGFHALFSNISPPNHHQSSSVFTQSLPAPADLFIIFRNVF